MSDDISKLTTEELGQLFPILIVEYNPEWALLYLDEKQNICRIIDSKSISRIEHIGSTAVPGLCSKPTIDILLEITGSTDLDLLKNSLQKINYQYIPKAENPPPCMMFAKGYSLSGITGQTYHIHIRYPGDWDELVFRNYLIDNQQVANEYARLKRKLSKEYEYNREKYTENKTTFIQQVTRQARLKRIR